MVIFCAGNSSVHLTLMGTILYKIMSIRYNEWSSIAGQDKKEVVA